MPKIILFLVIVLCVSCKESVSETKEAMESSWEITADSLPNKIGVDAKARVILNDWTAYVAIERSFDKMYTVEFREDFVLIVEEMIENQKKMEDSEYPTAFDIPQIKGRQKIFKTFILKMKGDIEYRLDPKESMVQTITAFNNLRSQFNVVVNNTLPEQLKQNEEN